jgi:Ca2+-binding EF-hand superfamily protein
MSLGIGGDYAAQRLASLFSALQASPTSGATDTSTSTSAMSSTDDTSDAAPDNCLTGSSQAQLSGDILNTLIQIQGGSAGSTDASTTTGTTDPVQSLFSAMDTDGNGSVSQSEMEGYLESNGATQGQADAVYTALDPNGGSSGISESQMASAAQSSAPAGGMPHHHHHHHAGGADGTNADSNPLDQLMAEIGSSSSGGSVSQDAFSSIVTSNGGTSADAASDFSALDTDGSGMLTSADFATTWQNAQSSQGASTFMVSMLDAFAKANTAASSVAATGTTTSVSA